MNKLLLLLFLIPFIGLSQRYPFFKYSTEEGLPQSQVTCISQDKDGYLWIGTLGGLAKFNGEKFTPYSVNDGLLNNRIKTLDYIDDKMWVGVDGGLSVIHKGKIKAFSFGGENMSRAPSEFLKFNGKYLVFTNGGGVFEFINNTLSSVELDEKFHRIRSAHVHANKLYLATRNGILTSTDGTNFEFFNELDSISFSGVTGNSEQLVFTTYKKGVYIKTLSSGKWRHISAEKMRYNINSVFQDQTNQLWFGSQEGFLTLENDTVFKHYNVSNGLPVNNISCFHEDTDGFIWIGSMGKGLFRFPGKRFEYYDRSTNFPTDLYLGGFQEKSGDYFFATYDIGILKYNPYKDETAKRIGEKISGATVWATANDVDKSNWFGTEVSLARFHDDGRIQEYFNKDGVPGSKISGLYRINSTSMYIGGSDGVSIYKNGEITYLTDGYDIGTVRDFEILDNTVYCVSNLGLYSLVNDKFERYKNVSDVIYCIEKDESNNLWYGTEEGLYKITNGKIKLIPLISDSYADYVNFINYKDGQLFVGTNNGMFILQDLDKNQPSINRRR